MVCWRREEEGVCTFKTSPCVPAPRAFFQCVAHQTHTTTTNNTTTTTTHTTHHNTQHHTETQTERETEKECRERGEDERGETRQNNRRQKKTGQHEREERRQKINFQCGGAWPFFDDVVLCLVHPVNDRVFSLVNRVKYDSSLISFSAS